jgi:hydrogenase accessory protein HypB
VSGDVGNLVCPALFELGEQAKVAILSVTDGEDKPLKYPHMSRASSIMIINKIDLLPPVDFDVHKAIKNALAVNPNITTYRLSARSGEGLVSFTATRMELKCRLMRVPATRHASWWRQRFCISLASALASRSAASPTPLLSV